MQQLQFTQSEPRHHVAELPTSFVQRLSDWARQEFSKGASSNEKFDDRDLDQRVRESGEW